MEQAIKKAIEGGWKYKLNSKLEWDGENYDYVCVALLDPLFWQALGKAEGWTRWPVYPKYAKNEEWKYHATKFMEHIMEGKDIDSFFNELLK